MMHSQVANVTCKMSISRHPSVCKTSSNSRTYRKFTHNRLNLSSRAELPVALLRPCNKKSGLKLNLTYATNDAAPEVKTAEVVNTQVTEDVEEKIPEKNPELVAAQEAAAAAMAAEPLSVIESFLSVEGNSWNKYFFQPEQPVVGSKARLFLNRARTCLSDENQSHTRRTQLIAGFNDWQSGNFEVEMQEFYCECDGDWFFADFEIPEQCFSMNFVFSNGELFDKQDDGSDFLLEPAMAASREEADAWMEEEKAKEEQRKQEEEIERQSQADMLEAQNVINHQRHIMGEQLERAQTEYNHEDGYPIARCTGSGESFTLFFNKEASHLKEHAEVSVTYGVNGWTQPTKAADMEPCPAPQDAGGQPLPGEWFKVNLPMAQQAYVLNFVVSDQAQTSFDNNNGNDFNFKVGSGEVTEAQWEAGVLAHFHAVRKDRLEAVLAAERKEAERAARRKAAREEAMAVLRKKQMHVLYTEPAEPVAGELCTVYYNNLNTHLEWCPEVWARVGFNRWTHAEPLAPLKMEPKEGVDHKVASFTVPKDAHTIDLVFSSGGGDEDGTQYDNAGGLDYHFSTKGASVKPEPLHIMHIAVEMAPIAKVGGLGDVVTSLSRAVQEMGHNVEIVLPKYAFLDHSPVLNQMEYEGSFSWGGCDHHIQTQIVEGVRVFFIDSGNGFFRTGSVYQGNGDGGRFDFFCKAALEFMVQTQRQPDIIHCHDWSTAMATKFFWEDYHHNGLWKPRCVFTIHNLEFGQAKIGEAMFNSQVATTVSPSYAGEVSGHPAVSGQLAKFHGVVNGIDVDIWDPSTDQFLPHHYDSLSCTEGKAACRRALRERLGLTGWEDKPIIGIVSRLTAQKGIDLIKHCASHAKFRGAQFVLLGSAPDPRIQADFNALGSSLGDENASFIFSYDEPLSHLIYAGCDMICVPSIFEPCGLTQLIAMRYGAVPVVRQTGGLYDTVYDVDHDQARAAWEMLGVSGDDYLLPENQATNGFSFGGMDSNALNYALDRALDSFYNDRDWFRSLQARAMSQDWSWNRPAMTYLELYYQAKKN